jgi:hypothetical protein
MRCARCVFAFRTRQSSLTGRQLQARWRALNSETAAQKAKRYYVENAAYIAQRQRVNRLLNPKV